MTPPSAMQKHRTRNFHSRRVGAFQEADVILANLYSELLIASTPGLAKKIKPGGHFIFSRGLGTPRLIKRGKWCPGICPA